MIGIIILPIGLIWNSWLRSYMYKRLTLIGVAIESLEFRSEKLLTLDSILEKTGITYNAITDIQSRRKFTKLFYSKKIWELYEQFYILIWIFIVNLLTKLRSDLKIRLDEEEKILESAKSEVEKNIQWTTELDDVSKMQKTRLDRQIEQFEELQRVLVKV